MLDAGDDVIRLRWGIWNFQEAALDLSRESPGVRKAMLDFFAKLTSGKSTPSSFENDPDLSAIEAANLEMVINELRQTGFLNFDRPEDHGTQMARALLGNLDLYRDAGSFEARVAFASDSTSAVDYMESQVPRLGISVDALPASFMQSLHDADFTSGMGGLPEVDRLELLCKQLEIYDSMIFCISRASILALRNLNRVMLKIKKPMIVGLIDGPFVTVTGCDVPATGCLECFEQRSLARLEDHVSYHQFARSGAIGASSSGQANGVESLLCATLLNEAVLLCKMGVSRFIGRALSTYLPTYEMQAQDVLRIPTCPACGHVSRDISEEINFSSRVVIDEHTRQALGVPS